MWSNLSHPLNRKQRHINKFQHILTQHQIVLGCHTITYLPSCFPLKHSLLYLYWDHFWNDNGVFCCIVLLGVCLGVDKSCFIANFSSMNYWTFWDIFLDIKPIFFKVSDFKGHHLQWYPTLSVFSMKLMSSVAHSLICRSWNVEFWILHNICYEFSYVYFLLRK